MATVAEIKAKLKALLDATEAFGSVYTEDRERIEQPQPAAVLMWHDGGSAEPEANTAEEVTTSLLLRLLVPRGPVGGEVVMQQTTDTKLEKVRETIRKNPTLATNGLPLVLSCRTVSWDIGYDAENARMETEIRVSVTYEEG